MPYTNRSSAHIDDLLSRRRADSAVLQDAFPLRLAGIDVGSNAIRFIGVAFDSAGKQRVLCAERGSVRLGHDVFISGKLSERQMDAGMEVIRSFCEKIEAHQIPHLRAVATSAVREARNGGDFVDRVAREVGIQIEMISGSEEARLIHRAVRASFSLEQGRWILVDLGGGSVEVSLVDQGGVLWSESHTIGSVRLLEELSSSGQEPGRFRQLLAEQVNALRIPSSLGGTSASGFIATGGNIEALARLADPSGIDDLKVLSLERLRAIIEKLAQLSFRQRVEELGLKQDRADVILPAAVVYEHLCRSANQTEIIVPFVGLREGLILDLFDRLSGVSEYEGRRDREAHTSAVNLGRRYMFDEQHGVHVARLALVLFDQLATQHGLGDEERRLLLVAAVLHDIGQYVNYKKHHKHSLYLISQSELAGLTMRQMLMVANIARYHRKSEPAGHHEAFTRLRSEEQQLVTQLGAVLRLADALDREHRGRVKRVEAQIKGRDLLLRLSGEGDMLLERWVVYKKSEFFTRVFQLRVKLLD